MEQGSRGRRDTLLRQRGGELDASRATSSPALARESGPRKACTLQTGGMWDTCAGLSSCPIKCPYFIRIFLKSVLYGNSVRAAPSPTSPRPHYNWPAEAYPHNRVSSFAPLPLPDPLPSPEYPIKKVSLTQTPSPLSPFTVARFFKFSRGLR